MSSYLALRLIFPVSFVGDLASARRPLLGRQGFPATVVAFTLIKLLYDGKCHSFAFREMPNIRHVGDPIMMSYFM